MDSDHYFVRCNDNNELANPQNLYELPTTPGGTNFCNGVDDNCDGIIDNAYTFYRDADGDGLGNPYVKAYGCSSPTPPAGYVINANDCNDADNTNSILRIYVNKTATGIKDGSSWQNAFTTLQDALAHPCKSINEIWVAKGFYFPDEGVGRVYTSRGEAFEMRSNLAIYGGFVGTETSLSQRNWKLNVTTLSGDVNGGGSLVGNSYHIIYNTSATINTTARLDGFYITGGNASDNNIIGITAPYEKGAAIYNAGAYPTIVNCVFDNNKALQFGGAVYNEGVSGNVPVFENCTFKNNSAASGGAMYNATGEVTLTNCEFYNNAAQSEGGAIRNFGITANNITNCSFYGNTSSTDGKDVRCDASEVTTITNSIFWGNNSPLYQPSTGSISVNYSIVQQASGVFAGTGNLNSNPIFQNEATRDLRLQAGSPAINTGSDAANSTTIDLAGNPRKRGVIDMGAYEVQSVCSPISLSNSTIAPLAISGCGTAAIGSTTFAYSTTAVALTTTQYNAIGFAINAGSCAVASVSYTDAINQTLSVAGKQVVTRSFIIKDVNNATVIATQQITVEDKTPPSVITKNITVQLTSGGSLIITAQQVNNGSSDACGNVTLSLDKTTFDCNNIGQNTVMLTGTDVNGNIASATAIVTVEDKTLPTVITKNITAQIDAGGVAVIADRDVDNGSYDPCGLVLYQVDKTRFDCSNIGPNTVTLTVKDINGNIATGTAIVTVEDKTKPIVITKNITAQIDAGGIAVIADRDVDNGSYDACGLVLYKLDKTSFYCNNVGPNTVTLTVTDANGNQASGTAIVTVEDHALPTVITKNITVQLDATGSVAISDRAVDNGSYDACGLILYKLDKTTFTCFNVGDNTVTLTVTDANGNKASGTAIITVQGNAATSWILDNDADGYYPGNPVIACTSPGAGYIVKTTQQAGDCDDANPALNPATVWYEDRDNDGYSSLYTVTGCARPKIYYGGAFSLTFTYGKLASELTSLTQDCDDTKAAVNPGIVWYKDADNDGFSDGTTQSACYRPNLYKLSNEVITGGDCNDADARINPTTKWYPDNDNDGYSTGDYIVQCLRPLNGKLQTELTSITGDCNDNNAALNPATKWYKDADNDGYSDGTIKTQCTQPTSYKLATALTAISGDCNDADAALNPATVWITDADVDGYYPGIPVIRCTSPGAGYLIKSTQLAGDCSDNSASVNPAAVEVCGNGIDDNCNGVIDEATCYPCQNATGLITTSITATDAQLNWTAIANPVQWQVQYKTTKQGSKWVDVFLTGNKRSVVLTGLLSNQNYQWQIRAKCGSSWTNYSITAGFKTGGTNTLTRVAQSADEMAAEPGARIYPNPTQGVFMLEMQLPENDNGTVNIQVIDLTGRILQTEIASITKGHLKKNMSLQINLAKGIYLLRIIAGNKTYTTRLVYEK